MSEIIDSVSAESMSRWTVPSTARMAIGCIAIGVGEQRRTLDGRVRVGLGNLHLRLRFRRLGGEELRFHLDRAHGAKRL